jgi:hypothetical protein
MSNAARGCALGLALLALTWLHVAWAENGHQER